MKMKEFYLWRKYWSERVAVMSSKRERSERAEMDERQGWMKVIMLSQNNINAKIIKSLQNHFRIFLIFIFFFSGFKKLVALHSVPKLNRALNWKFCLSERWFPNCGREQNIFIELCRLNTTCFLFPPLFVSSAWNFQYY